MIPSEPVNGIFTTDLNLTIVSWDDWLAETTRIPVSEACGKSLAALFPELEARGLLARFQRVLAEGVVEVLAPTFHHYLFASEPATPSKYFDKMRQHVIIAPLRQDGAVIGAIVTIADVTARLEQERDLNEQLTSPDEGTRLRAARALAEQDRLESTDGLIDVMGDRNWRVRRQAVDGLARHARQDVARSLLRILREQHRNLSVLNSALQVLALSGVDAVAPLVECLSDRDDDLRIYAAQALGDRHDARATRALIGALDDPEMNVRYHAIEALGKLRAVEAIDSLLGLAESGDFFLAFPSLDALRAIGDTRIAARLVPLLENEMLRSPAADALGQLGDDETVAPLVALLNEPGAPTQVIAQSLAALYDRYEATYREGNYIVDLVRRSTTATGARNLLDAIDETGDSALRSLVLVLGWIEGEAARRALTRLLGKATARQEVVEALVRHGSQVTQLLIEQVESNDLDARQAAVLALGRIGDSRAVPALVGALTTDEELLIPCANALAKIGDRRAFQALLGILGHPLPAVRHAVIAALNSIGHPEMAGRALKLLQDPDPLVRESAVRISGYFGYPECRDLLFERCADPDENVRCAALEHIPYLEDDRAVRILIDVVQNGTPRARASAAQAMAQVEDTRVVPFLLAALNDPDRWVRYFAAQSIGQIDHKDSNHSLDVLANLIQSDSALQVRIVALESLARIGGSPAVVVLAPLTESNDPVIATAALGALGLADHPDALAPLVNALRSPDPARRIKALSALGERGGKGAVDAVQWVAAADDDPRVVQTAIDALARLATEDAIDKLVALASDPARHEACVAALSQLRGEHIGRIGQGLNDAQPGVRLAVIEALGRMKRPRASELLGKALDDADGSVRLAAVNALARLGSRGVERKLVAMAHSDSDAEVRRAAQKALGK